MLIPITLDSTTTLGVVIPAPSTTTINVDATTFQATPTLSTRTVNLGSTTTSEVALMLPTRTTTSTIVVPTAPVATASISSSLCQLISGCVFEQTIVATYKLVQSTTCMDLCRATLTCNAYVVSTDGGSNIYCMLLKQTSSFSV
jgi:hypothetical protein